MAGAQRTQDGRQSIAFRKLFRQFEGGFRRGTDVFKALALGARAICIGRPYMWGVAAFGQSGVETVLEILRREFNLVMAECGKSSLAEIGPAAIIKRS